MKKNTIFVLLVLLVSQYASAHGEDKYGPHKGFVRMPGAFHTELVLDGQNQLKVYLLDIEWKNPSVKKSQVQVKYNNKTDAKCDVQSKESDSYFLCVFPAKVDLNKKGELKVIAVREEQKGAEAIYKLPLKLEISTPSPDQHSGHSGHH